MIVFLPYFYHIPTWIKRDFGSFICLWWKIDTEKEIGNQRMNQDENDDDVKYITPTNDDDIQTNVEAHAYREHITSLL